MPVVLRDDTGAVLGTPTINLPAQGHTSFLLTPTYAVTAGKRGTVEFDTPGRRPDQRVGPARDAERHAHDDSGFDEELIFERSRRFSIFRYLLQRSSSMEASGDARCGETRMSPRSSR